MMLTNNNKHGSILVTVIMLILAIMALASGLLSSIASQGTLGQSQVKKIKAEQFAKGLFWRFYHQTNFSGTMTPLSETIPLDGQNYTGTVTIAPSPTKSPLITTNTITTTVSY